MQILQNLIDWGDLMLKENPPKFLSFADVIDKIEEVKNNTDVGEISDGYHTFNELYEYRKIYNAALFNEWAANHKYWIHKSYKHYDGELCFGGGWFIVVAILPGGQISNHYKAEDWDLFKCKSVEKALFEYDGHTSKDVIERIKDVCNNYKNLK